MTERTTITIEPQPSIVEVSEDEYLAQYAEQFYEWINGRLLNVSPVSSDHDELTQYLLLLFRHYLHHRAVGRIKIAPFPMRLPPTNSWREPDLQFILNENVDNITSTFVDGPADICIEIVSPNSVERDHGEKLVAYESGGVHEYWIIDPVHQEARFQRLNDDGKYVFQPIDDGVYRTPLLPDFVLNIADLWRDPLPDVEEILAAVEQMVKA